MRTDDQTLAGIYWAYDGTPTLCAPPRLYNQIAEVIATQMGSDVAELARLFALVNVAMADAGIAIWESKYFYKLWRPVTGIREADPGTGPTGIGDRNPLTRGDATFSPLGAPASNLNAPNFTPPFPAYPSGHAGFGGALFQILRKVYGRDDIPFTFVSDELNGVTVDNEGRRAAAPAAQLHVAVAGRGGERPEPHLPGHPLVVRQDGGDRAGTAGGRLRVHARVPAGALTQLRPAEDGAVGNRGARRSMRPGFPGEIDTGPGRPRCREGVVEPQGSGRAVDPRHERT